MAEIIEGSLQGEGLKIGLVISRFNNLVTEKLLEGAKDRLSQLGMNLDHLSVARVPGAFELPRGVKAMANRGDLDGIIALGAVVRGETPHFEYVANEASKGLAQLNMKLDVPVTFGLITADTMDQALNRAGGKQGNKGVEASEALVEMINLEREINQ